MFKRISFILIILLFFIPIASAQSITSTETANNFTVTWYDCNFALTQSSCKVDIQNLLGVNRDFNLSGLVSDTNYDLTTYNTTMTIKEWKILPTQVPIYETVLVSQTCYTFDNSTNTSVPYDCSYNQTVQNGTKLMNLTGWKTTKTNMQKEVANQKMYYGTINIPKYDSKAKLDDLNNTETVNGTKTFMVEWDTPIVRLGIDRWGSSGKIAFIEEDSGQEYHPWWNASYYRVPILLNNTGNATNLKYFQVSFNVTYSSTSMDANFTSGHLVNDTSGLEEPFWIESQVNGSYANVWGNFSNIPASVWTNTTYYWYSRNATEISASSGTNTFDFFDDFSGDLSKWTNNQPTYNYIVAGELKVDPITAGTGEQLNDIYTNQTFIPQNTILEFTHRISGSTTSAPYFIGWRGDGTLNNKYRISFNPYAATNDLAIIATVAGVSSTGVSGGNHILGTNYKFKAYISGNTFYVNTDLISLSETDAKYTNITSANVGMSQWADTGTAYYDDIRVRKLASPVNPTAQTGAEEAPSPPSILSNTICANWNAIVNVTTYYNGNNVQTNTSVTTSCFTNSSMMTAKVNLTMTGTSVGGSKSQTWLWNYVSQRVQVIISG